MLAFKVAFRNLIGAGLKTWLNVIVLSMSYVIIIFYNSMMDGWDIQAKRDMIAWEIGQGQFWENDFDPYDPYTLVDAHAPIPPELQDKNVVPILYTQASVYPEGRMQNITLKGVPRDQTLLDLPTDAFQTEDATLPAIIGERMAEATKLKAGDHVLLRWRDKNGTFDATEITIAKVFKNNVPATDAGQVYIPLDRLQEMTGMANEATMIIADQDYRSMSLSNWTFKDHDFLLADLDAVIASKKGSSAIMYLLLLAIALLAIFDTQVLSIFRRQKEIGTYIALGMTRGDVVRLFTIEGGAHSLLAAGLGAIYGVPLFYYLSIVGIPMPAETDSAGLPISSEIIPVYGIGLVIGTVLLVVISATIVSYMPARKISKMKPTEALKGKIQ